MMISTDLKQQKPLPPSKTIPLSPVTTPFNSTMKEKNLKQEQWKIFKWMSIGGVMYMFFLQFTSIQSSYSRREVNPNDPIPVPSQQYQQQEQQQYTNHNMIKPIKPLKWTCTWSPEPNKQGECNELLFERLPPPIVPTNVLQARDINVAPQKQRWLFFGDSTMKRPFTLSNLNRYLVEEPFLLTKVPKEENGDQCWSSLICDERHVDRCDHASVFQFDTIPDWQSPIHSPNFEGPTNYAVDKPYCSDCGGCDPHFLHCIPNTYNPSIDIEHLNETCEKKKLVYGGFMKVEFARDVELQTSMYRTTQENTAFYLREQFNTPELVRQWGQPICVIGTGFHDMILLIKTDDFNKDRFVENVEWYLYIMKDVCSHIIWLTNTAPSYENPQ